MSSIMGLVLPYMRNQSEYARRQASSKVKEIPAVFLRRINTADGEVARRNVEVFLSK